MENRKMKEEFMCSTLMQPKYDYIKMAPSPYIQHLASVSNYTDKVFKIYFTQCLWHMHSALNS